MRNIALLKNNITNILKNKSMKNFLILSVLFLFILNHTSLAQQHKIRKASRIREEEKLYELSMIWKEVSYNFDNMDNCPNLNVDSLYRAYIPLVRKTQDDLEDFKLIQRFMAHFNNAHTCMTDFPTYLDDYMGRLYLKSIYKNGKIFVENIPIQHVGKLNIGDEIITINGIDAVEYFKQNYIPYYSLSNADNKMSSAMFAYGLPHCHPLHTKFILGIKTSEGIKKVKIFADRKMDDVSSKWIVKDFSSFNDNIFAIDLKNSFAYINLNGANSNSDKFFAEHIDSLRNIQDLILDLSHHGGGQAIYNRNIYEFLLKQDTISYSDCTTRVNRPFYKARGAYWCNDTLKGDALNDFYCACFHNTHFEPIEEYTNYKYLNTSEKSSRFQGNIYVIIGDNTFSAGEDLVNMLSQDKNIKFFGKKTGGSTGNPYRFRLPSGIEIRPLREIVEAKIKASLQGDRSRRSNLLFNRLESNKAEYESA